MSSYLSVHFGSTQPQIALPGQVGRGVRANHTHRGNPRQTENQLIIGHDEIVLQLFSGSTGRPHSVGVSP